MEDRFAKSLRAVSERPSTVGRERPFVPPMAVPDRPAVAREGESCEKARFDAFHEASRFDRRRISIIGTLSLSLLLSAGFFALQLAFRSHGPNLAEKGKANIDRGRTPGRRSLPSRDSLVVRSAPEIPDEDADTSVRPERRRQALRESRPKFTIDDEAHLTDGLFSQEMKNAAAELPIASTAIDKAVDPTIDGGSTLAFDRTLEPPKRSSQSPIATRRSVKGVAVNAAVEQDEPKTIEPIASPAPDRGEKVYSLFEKRPDDSVSQTSPRAPDPQTPTSAMPNAPANASITPSPGPPVHHADWNSSMSAAAPDGSSAPGAASQPVLAQSSLDTSGPLIVPGRIPPPGFSIRRPAPIALQGPSLTVEKNAQPQLRPPQPKSAVALQQMLAERKKVSELFDGPAEPSRPSIQMPPEQPNPLAELDRTRPMRFDFRNAPWKTVFVKFAEHLNLELKMDGAPSGTFNYRDSNIYKPSQVLAILNAHLEPRGYRMKVEGRVLHVIDLSQPALPSGSQQATAQIPGPPPDLDPPSRPQ